MQKNNYQNIILVTVMTLSQNISYAQSISEALLNTKSNEPAQVSQAVKTTPVLGSTSVTTVVASAAVSRATPVPLTKELINFSEANVTLVDQALLVRLNDLATLAAQEGLLKKWYLNDVTIAQLNSLAQQ